MISKITLAIIYMRTVKEVKYSKSKFKWFATGLIFLFMVKNVFFILLLSYGLSYFLGGYVGSI